MIDAHVESGPTSRSASLPVVRSQEAISFGVMGVDEEHRVGSFAEKPADPDPHSRRPPPLLGVDRDRLLRARYMFDRLCPDAAADRESARLRQKHHPVDHRRPTKCWPIRSWIRTLARPMLTGGTSDVGRLLRRRTWTSWRSIRS